MYALYSKKSKEKRTHPHPPIDKLTTHYWLWIFGFSRHTHPGPFRCYSTIFHHPYIDSKVHTHFMLTNHPPSHLIAPPKNNRYIGQPTHTQHKNKHTQICNSWWTHTHTHTWPRYYYDYIIYECQAENEWVCVCVCVFL